MGMVKALPAGKGLRSALKKIEKAKTKAPKGEAKKMKKLVNKDLGKKSPRGGLTNAALDTVREQEKDKNMSSSPAKEKKDAKKLVKMAKKIEKAKMPGNSDKSKYGMSESKLVKKLATAQKPKKAEITRLRKKVAKMAGTVSSIQSAGTKSPNTGVSASKKSTKTTDVFELAM